LFTAEFKARLATDPAFVTLLHNELLDVDYLVCSCKPAACHCDIEADYLNSVNSRGSCHCGRCGAELQLAGIDIYKCSWCGNEIDMFEDDGE
jgi:hypothetical protein